MDVSHLGRFEELSHYLIEHGFGDFFVRTHIIDDLTFFEKLAIWFEKKDSFAVRLKRFAVHGGPTMVHFVRYLGTRNDVFGRDLCAEFSAISYTALDDDLYRRRALVSQITKNATVKNTAVKHATATNAVANHTISQKANTSFNVKSNSVSNSKLQSKSNDASRADVGYRYNPHFGSEYSFKLSGANYTGVGSLSFDGVMYGFNLLNSNVKKTLPKFGVGTYYAYVIDTKLYEQYLVDIEILLLLAQKMDAHYSFSFSARRLVTDFMHHIMGRLDLTKVKHNTEIYLAALSTMTQRKDLLASGQSKYPQSVKVVYSPPRYLAKYCSKSQIIFWNNDDYNLGDVINHTDETQSSILTSLSTKSVADNLLDLILSPIFSHGYVLTDFTVDDFLVTKSGKVTLRCVRGLTELTHDEVVKFSLCVGALLTQDLGELRKLFPHTPLKEIPVITNTSQLEEFFIIFAQKHDIAHYYFDILTLLKFSESVMQKYVAHDEVVLRLREFVSRQLSASLERDYKFSKKSYRLNLLRSDIKRVSVELSRLPIETYNSMLSSLGYVILLLFSFFIILSTIMPTISFDMVIIAFLIVSFIFMLILSVFSKNPKHRYHI
jgi:hypothetical protein